MKTDLVKVSIYIFLLGLLSYVWFRLGNNVKSKIVEELNK